MVAKTLITGARGLLGSAILACPPAGVAARGATRDDGDLATPGAAAALLARDGGATAVIHCAGWTDVDGAESDVVGALQDNLVATLHVADACARAGAKLLLISSDYVFDGESDRPYREEDPPAPINAYGWSKLAAEQAALAIHPEGTVVARAAWLYGLHKRSFLDTVLEHGATDAPLRVIDDQRGCPTSAAALAPAVWALLAHAAPGVYHSCCAGECSWYEFATAAVEIAGGAARLEACRSADLKRPAARPAQSVLDCSRAGRVAGVTLPHWRAALEAYIRARPET
ncbi:MAG: dTDP-4-dehydrorhamnose reductase [Planctomycetota bacterium]|jgi:dTDP-4-dehydrorhamnose reductase